MKKLETKIFVGNTATNTAKTELIKVRSAVFFHDSFIGFINLGYKQERCFDAILSSFLRKYK